MMVYLHIPFCLAKCTYCDFNSYMGAGALIPEYLEALRCEMAAWSGDGDGITSLYIGGGTPSLLTPEQIGGLIACVGESYGLEPGAEVTVEVNPATWDESDMKHAVAHGVNRISLGIQSLDDKVLRVLGRPHDAAAALRALEGAMRSDALSVSADLIYGVPGQTLESWEHGLQELLVRGPQHVSAYALTVEENTPLSLRVAAGALRLPDEDEMASMYLATCELLRARGYRHYEISNFCLPGHACRHNEGYWNRRTYLGCGAGAHSFDGKVRRWGPAGLEEYMIRARSGALRYGTEVLDDSARHVEEVMLGLRTDQGIAAAGVKVLPEWEREGLVSRPKGKLSLTDRGMLVSNEIISTLLARV